MDSILKFPSRTYDYVYGHYGSIGVLFGALILIMFFLSVYFYFDRRRA